MSRSDPDPSIESAALFCGLSKQHLREIQR
jgi:hypothetical protein